MTTTATTDLWALLLGGSSGLGLATAKKLAQHGYNIIVLHRDRRSDLEAIKKDFQEITSTGVQLKSYNIDVTKSENIRTLIAEFKDVLQLSHKIKILVHSIAKGNLKPMVAANEPSLGNADFHLTVDAMAINIFDWTQALATHNLFNSDARIIAFTSEGNTKAWPHYAAVSAAKAALEAIVRNIALEYASVGIKANCIQAGVTDTASLKRIPGSELLKSHALKRNPHKRLTTPEDVANAVYLLSTEEAKWITGTVIKVDGGEHLS